MPSSPDLGVIFQQRHLHNLDKLVMLRGITSDEHKWRDSQILQSSILAEACQRRQAVIMRCSWLLEGSKGAFVFLAPDDSSC